MATTEAKLVALLRVQAAAIKYATEKAHETRIIFTVPDGLPLRDSSEYALAVRGADNAYSDFIGAVNTMQDLILEDVS